MVSTRHKTKRRRTPSMHCCYVQCYHTTKTPNEFDAVGEFFSSELDTDNLSGYLCGIETLQDERPADHPELQCDGRSPGGRLWDVADSCPDRRQAEKSDQEST